MSTIREVIERVDGIKSNAFSDEQKVIWLAMLDGKIAADLFLMSISDIRMLKYRYPQDMETELLVSFPHDDIYDGWLGAQIDYANGEYDKYQNSMALYNASYDSFAVWFLNTYDPAQGYMRRNEDEL